MISIHALREEGDRSRPCPSRPLANFYPRPPRGGRPRTTSIVRCSLIFLSTPSARRATHCFDMQARDQAISIHALREEGDVRALLFEEDTGDFYPRPPRGGRPRSQRPRTGLRNFYPRPPRGGRHSGRHAHRGQLRISIHALREEGDPHYRRRKFPGCEISIHALREEGDKTSAAWTRSAAYFYPRPPRGGRHPAKVAGSIGKEFLSTPSARRATIQWRSSEVIDMISIHALREEGDTRPAVPLFWRHGFLSTPSARRATTTQLTAESVRLISIHALREEGDKYIGGTRRPVQHFYPRPPRGGRPASIRTMATGAGIFLSTPSARRATCSAAAEYLRCRISIHALREEGDSCGAYHQSVRHYFYPRPPRGGRLLLLLGVTADGLISIHALREEGDP